MKSNNELEKRRSKLSAEQRRLLEQWKVSEVIPEYTITSAKGKNAGTVSPAQMRLWFMDQLLEDKASYNMYAAVRLRGVIQTETIESAFRVVANRHENLRSNFLEQEGRPVVVVDNYNPVHTRLYDISPLDDRTTGEEAQRLLQSFISEPFDLSGEPLFRTMLIRLAPEENILAVCMHHIISDGWSMGILLKEWTTAYNALLHNSEPSLPEIPVSYADFAHWQLDKLESGEWNSHLHYWKSLLSGASSAALTPDNRHPDRMEHNGNEVRFVLPGGLYRQLSEFSVGSGLTLFTVLFSIFNVLLYRYTKETSIVTGTPIANRNYTEIEEIIGYFVNLLPLRVELDPQMSFRELAGRVMQSSQEAYSHQDFPFDRVIEELQPERTDQLIPLIRNLFVFQNQMIPPLRLNGIDTEYLELYNHTSKSDLLLSMIVREGSIHARLEYDGRLFVPQTMQSFAEHFVRLAESAMEHPDLPICRLKLMDETGQQPQFSPLDIQNTEHFVIHHKFEQMAAQFSSRIALQWDSETWTYGQLEQRANQIARYINGLGVCPGEFVGLFMERSPQVVASILGILKAGCAYVPMDPAYPEERIRFMLNDAGCRVMLVDNLTEARLTATSEDCLIVNLSSAEGTISQLPAASVQVDSKSTDLAYMIYTSGSTGAPKGVLIDHGNVSRLFTATNEQFHFDEHDVWSLFHSYAFDFSVWEIWGALFHGGKLVIVPGHVTRSFELFYELIVREKVTVLNQTPSAFKQLSHTEELLCSDVDGSGLNHLRYVIFGGEALELSSLDTWLKRHGDECPRLINMYGITEITVHATYRRIRTEDLQGTNGHVIGNPLQDMRAYVLDEWMQMVPVGVAGELYIGGPGVSRGYWNREALNQTKFIQDPFITGSVPQASSCRLYRSGDLARWTHDNELEYVGRIDNQVKVRGFRIELGEVETAIQQNENVSQNVAVVEHNQFGDPRIVSYFIPYEHRVLELRRELQKKEQVTNRWELVFDGYYQEDNIHEDKSFHIVGWNDSYSGEAIPEAEMEEWTRETVARIRSYRPRRILEIGCGTGLLLFRLAADCESYTAIDFSAQAIEYLRAHLPLLGPDASKVKLYKANAHDLDGLDLDEIDMVIINSVAQYFPDVQYLNLVLEKAAKKLGARGCIFLGDVCGMMFGEMHQASVAMSRAEPDMIVADFKRLVRHRLDRHNELMLDVSYFTGLSNAVGELEYTELLYKRGKFHHEMNKYRFDAVLHKGAKPVWEIAEEYDWRQLREAGADIEALHLQHEMECYVIRNVPNSRIMTEWDFVQWYNTAYPQTALSAYPVEGRQETPDLHQMQLAWESASHRLEWVITDTASRGCVDAVFYPVRGEKLLPCLTLMAGADCALPAANLPLRAKLETTMEQHIKASLKGRIPEYMIPSEFVALESFPLTVNGKIDRSQLRLFKPYKAIATSSEDIRQEGTEMEEVVRRFWMDLLDTGYVGLDESFFEAGGHSLLVVQLMFQIKQSFKVHIPLLQLMQEPTVRGISAAIERVLSEQPAAVFDFSADIALSPDITAGGLSPAARIPGSAVLLTGATGFFRAFLLRELLETGDKLVYCLVRTSGREEGFQRIVAALKRYGCWKDEWKARIIAVKGDLALPGLGLDAAVYKELSIEVAEIYHNGAIVNFAQPYASLAAANVGGCEEVLRLASTEMLKPVHFISTLYVFSLEDIKSKKIILENDVPVYLQSLQLGYTQSKWAAEQLMREARVRGIPVNVFRLGRIAGDSLTGACQENDFFWRSVRLCLHLGIFPDIDFAFNLIPADYAAQAVIHLAERGMENQTYHLLSGNDYTFFQVLDVLSSRGYSFEPLPWEQWKCRAEEQLEHGGSYEDASVMPFIGEMAGAAEYPQFDAAFTRSSMDRLSLPSVFVTNEILASYIDYFINRAFFMPLVKSDMG